MNRGKFKGEFLNELMFFSGIAKRDLREGFTTEEVKNELISFTTSFYDARLNFDKYAVKKINYIEKYAYQIIKGTFDDYDLSALCDEIEAEDEEIRVGKL